MARDTNEQKAIKIKILWEAIEILKEKTTPSKNLALPDRITELANEKCTELIAEGILKSPIGVNSIKTPTSPEFRELKKEIDKFKEEYKKIKKAAPKKSLKEVSELKQTVENLVSEIAKFYDEKLILLKTIESKDRSIEKLKEERNFYLEEIKKLKE